jgi:hypothetical protein
MIEASRVVRPNGLELSGPAKTRSCFRAESWPGPIQRVVGQPSVEPWAARGRYPGNASLEKESAGLCRLEFDPRLSAREGCPCETRGNEDTIETALASEAGKREGFPLGVEQVGQCRKILIHSGAHCVGHRIGSHLIRARLP